MGLTNFTNPPRRDDDDPNVNGGNGNNGGIPPFGGMGILIAQPNGGGKQKGAQQDVSELFINYNEKFKNHSKVLFRDEVIEQLLSILIGKDKPNGLLIGPAGTGKTAIVETIATMLANNDPLIPDQIKDYTIWELPLSNVVAGASLVGQLEDNVKMVVDKMSDPDEKAILFIDEIHQLINGNQTYDKIAQILKPALARGNLHVIGATTLQEANNLMSDPAFNRRFSRVIVDELSRTQTVEILKSAKQSFINHYISIAINDDLLETVSVLADQYRPAGSHRPDNALTLLDRTIGEAIINRKVQINNLQTKVNNDPNDVVSQNMLTMLQSAPTIPITENQVKKTAISLATGNSKRDAIDMNHVKMSFARIKGQDEATEECLKMMARSESNLFPKKSPTTMMFIGPSGVGKTEIAKIIAQEMTGHEPIILNMTEYSDPSTINRIIGAPAGYVGSDSHAELPFDGLEANPFAVILLDEFEKAHPAVQRLFYTVFDEGVLVDNHGKKIDFSKAIIIATTNAANQEAKNKLGFGTDDTTHKASIKELSKFFDPALLNRFNHRVQFNKISKDVYKSIIEDIYARESARIIADNKVSLPANIPDDELNEIVKTSYHEEFGARPAFQAVKKFIEDQVFAQP